MVVYVFFKQGEIRNRFCVIYKFTFNALALYENVAVYQPKYFALNIKAY